MHLVDSMIAVESREHTSTDMVACLNPSAPCALACWPLGSRLSLPSIVSPWMWFDSIRSLILCDSIQASKFGLLQIVQRSNERHQPAVPRLDAHASLYKTALRDLAPWSSSFASIPDTTQYVVLNLSYSLRAYYLGVACRCGARWCHK